MDAASKIMWASDMESARAALKAGRHAQAVKVLTAALSAIERCPWEHARIVETLVALGEAHYEGGSYAEAVPLFKRALTIKEQAAADDLQGFLETLDKLARLYRLQGKVDELEPIYAQALAIEEKIYGLSHANVAARLEKYGQVLSQLKRPGDALQASRRASEIKKANASAGRQSDDQASESGLMLKKQVMLIGHLLAASGLLDEDEVGRQLKLAQQLGMPLGQILVGNGYVSALELSAALDVQSIVLDGALSAQAGIKALSLVRSAGISLEAALNQVGFDGKNAVRCRLGDLLVEAGLLSKTDLEATLMEGKKAGEQLGKTLVLKGKLSAQVVAVALETQKQIRDHVLTHEKGVARLKSLATPESMGKI